MNIKNESGRELSSTESAALSEVIDMIERGFNRKVWSIFVNEDKKRKGRLRGLSVIFDVRS
jgi:hypothetical protein